MANVVRFIRMRAAEVLMVACDGLQALAQTLDTLSYKVDAPDWAEAYGFAVGPPEGDDGYAVIRPLEEVLFDSIQRTKAKTRQSFLDERYYQGKIPKADVEE